MKTFLGWLFVAIVAIGIAAFILWSRVPDALANNLSKKLGVRVEIEDIDISPSTLTIDNFEIGNVPRGVLAKALAIESTRFDASLTKYLGNPIVIEKIQMDNVYLGLEFDSATSTKGNWTRIFGNLQQNTTTAPTKDKKKGKTQQTPQPKNSDGGKTVIIKEVVINNISVDLVYLQGGGKIKKLPMIKQIVLKNINTQEGFPVDQLMNSVLGQMLTQVFIQQNLKNMIQSLIPDNSQLNELIQPFKGFLNP